MRKFNLLNDILNEIKNKYPNIGSGLLGNRVTEEDAQLFPYAEKILDYYFNYNKNIDISDISKSIDSFARISLDFLRLQARFMKTLKYSGLSERMLNKNLYKCKQKMEGYYLNGLFLTYALWPNHVKIYRYYNEYFLKKIPRNTNLIEVGGGHGLMALTLLKTLPGAKYYGIDLSDSSVRFTDRLLRSAGIAHINYKLKEGNATNLNILPFSCPKSGLSSGLCCEVLEHVEQPGKLLDFFKKTLQKKSKLFITTVINIDAEDHIYLFKNANEIRQLFYQNGLTTESELVLPLNNFKINGRFSSNYAAILIT